MKNSHVVFNPKDLSNSPFSRKDYSRPEYLATRKASEIGIKATTWAIPDFFPQGELTVLAGPKATGKSTIYCAISAAVSRGHIYPSWPGKLNQDPDGVLIISSEDDVERTIVPRLIAADADLNRIQIIDGVRKYSRETRAYTFDEADNERIVNTVDHMGGVGLIVIDPWSLVINGDSKNGIKVQRTLEKLSSLASKLNAAILLIAHVSKNSKGRDPITRVAGSAAVTDVARCVFITAKIEDGRGPDGSTHVLVRAATNLGKVGGGLSYSITDKVVYAGDLSVHTSKIEWHTELEGSPEDLLNEAEKTVNVGKQSAPKKAAIFLRDFLSDGPKPYPEIRKEAEKHDIRPSALARAKGGEIKIKSYKQPGEGSASPFMWTLD